ncbi:MAG: adenylosuccinate synthetase, partial [Sulfurovaceae bacterium]
SLCITHLDALANCDYIKICIEYKNKNGQLIDFTTDRMNQKQVIPTYVIFDSWKEDVSLITDYNKLPENMKKLIQNISNYTRTKIEIITVGKQKENTIFCNVIPEQYTPN